MTEINKEFIGVDGRRYRVAYYPSAEGFCVDVWVPEKTSIIGGFFQRTSCRTEDLPAVQDILCAIEKEIEDGKLNWVYIYPDQERISSDGLRYQIYVDGVWKDRSDCSPIAVGYRYGLRQRHILEELTSELIKAVDSACEIYDDAKCEYIVWCNNWKRIKSAAEQLGKVLSIADDIPPS